VERARAAGAPERVEVAAFDGSLSGAAARAGIEDVQSHVDKPRLAE